MGVARNAGALAGSARGPFESVSSGGCSAAGGLRGMDGPASAAHPKLADRTGAADRDHCEYSPERIGGTESFPAGRGPRVSVAAALRLAAQPERGRLEAGG